MNKIAILGSGNWGSAIAKIVGKNVTRFPTLFDTEVKMYVYEEEVTVGGKKRKLSQVINEDHENVKYLPNHKLPVNVVADTDAASAVRGANMIIFVLPHQFVPRLLGQISSSIRQDAQAISLIKGSTVEQGKIRLISSLIEESGPSGMPVSVLMGANVADGVANGDFCETTVGLSPAAPAGSGDLWKQAFQNDVFRVSVVSDVAGVELCGALKNIVALTCGFCDGLDLGTNTKAAVIRIGLLEMQRFVREFFPGAGVDSTFFESCGVADLITTCFGGRNRKCAEAFVRTGQSWEEIERDLLNGQKLQGTLTSSEVREHLRGANRVDAYPLFAVTHEIAFEGRDPRELFGRLVQLESKL